MSHPLESEPRPPMHAHERRPRTIRARLVPLAILVALGAGPAPEPPAAPAPGDEGDPSAEVLILRRCPIDYERSATMGSSQHGQIQECLVAPGERVKAGQVLGRLGDADVRAEIKLRELEAGSDVEIRLNEAKSMQAQIRLRTTQALVRRNAVSVEDFNLHKLEAEAAKLMVEQSKQSRRLAQVRLDQAQALLRSREFISPHDGVVVAILKRRGEPVAPNEPVFKVVDTRSLHITAQVDVTDSWRLKVGQSVRVIPDIAGADLPLERMVFQGKIVFIDSLIDPMSQTCKVLVQVANRDGLLRAGLEARLEIDARVVPDAKAPPAGPAASRPPPPPTPGPAPVPGPADRLTGRTR